MEDDAGEQRVDESHEAIDVGTFTMQPATKKLTIFGSLDLEPVPEMTTLASGTPKRTAPQSGAP